MISLKNTETCGAELMSLVIDLNPEMTICICIFVEHFDMPFKIRDNNYDTTYQSHSTWNPLK